MIFTSTIFCLANYAYIKTLQFKYKKIRQRNLGRKKRGFPDK